MNKKKIYFITSELPGRFGGSNSRNFNILKFINKSKFDVSLFTLIDKHREADQSQVEKELKIPIYSIQTKKIQLFFKLFILFFHKTLPSMQRYDNNKLSAIILEKVLINKPDIIQIQQITAYYAIRNIIPDLKDMGIKLVLDEHNVEHIAFIESLSSMNKVQRIFGRYIFPSYKKMEIKAINDMDHVLVCSLIDKRELSQYIDQKKIATIPNGVDCRYFNYQPNPVSKDVLFMGGTQYPPNDEALKFYLFKIHNYVKECNPNYKLYIIGSKPPDWLQKLALKDTAIILHGFVKDVRDYLHKVSVCLCPVLTGSGTRSKILEYLASGKAVVSTAKGAEGINLINKKELIIVDNKKEFISTINELLSNPKKISWLGKNGRSKMELEYNWSNFVLKLEKVYLSVLAE